MITTVKYLQNELLRFNPEQYLEREMEVRPFKGGVRVQPAGLNDSASDAEERVKELSKLAEEINLKLKDESLTLAELKSQIKTILIIAEAI